jgi:sterol desaturase/sphingolipid hydroxylase (fatty acid hydroxylase superfamily)
MSSRDLLSIGRGGPAALLRLGLPLALLAGLATIPLLGMAPELARTLQGFAAKVLARIGENVISLTTLPADYTEKFFILYFLLSFAVAAFALSREPAEGRGLLRRLFPWEIYTHRSARVDYGIVLINRVLTPSLLVTRLLSATAIGSWIGLQLAALFGPRAPLLSGTAALVAVTVLFALATDFSDYLQHVLHHRIRLLWEFHKLHHSAEVMTPLTALRNHPVEQIVGSLVATPILGVTIGLASYWLMEAPQPITLFGAQLMMVFFYSCCAVHLRHSHVWLSWSPRLSHLVISPAQHQIHHSSAPRHWNKNYGNVLAIWDWMFGSLYVPRERERFALGLAGEQPHPTLLKAYLEPLAGAVKVASESMRIRHGVGRGDGNG